MSNIVERLSRLTDGQKLEAKRNGRPMPLDVDITIAVNTSGRSFKRRFHSDIYKKANWICGCDVLNALFCFPCILFDGEQRWSQTGVRDLVHLGDKIKKHDNSQAHIMNQTHFALLGTANPSAELHTRGLSKTLRHNEEVTKHRYILSKMINCIKFCGLFGRELRGHDETETSSNSGLFHGLIDFSAELDNFLSQHLSTVSYFNRKSKDTQKGLLDCMLSVCCKHIANEIKEASFLAIIVEDFSDVSPKNQVGIVLRYVKSGLPVERFWGFISSPIHDATRLSKYIFFMLDPLLKENNNKLIAQSGNTQHIIALKIKKKYQLAYFVQSYAHHLNSILAQVASRNLEVRQFFANLSSIPTFFSISPHSYAVLKNMTKRKEMSSVTLRAYDFINRTVNTVFDNIDVLNECMGDILGDINNQNTNVLNQAYFIQRMLKDKVFLYWLSFFNQVTTHIDILDNQIQIPTEDPSSLDSALLLFEDSIKQIMSNPVIVVVKEDITECTSDDMPPTKRRKNHHELSQHGIALETSDAITSEVRHRNNVDAAMVVVKEELGEYTSDSNIGPAMVVDKEEITEYTSDDTPPPKRRNDHHELSQHSIVLETSDAVTSEVKDPNDIDPALVVVKEELREYTSYSNICPAMVVVKEGITEYTSDDTPPTIRRKDHYELSQHSIVLETSDAIISQVKDRLKFCGHKYASLLFLNTIFKQYSQSFPMKLLDLVVKTYPMLDRNRLKSELYVMYENKIFRKIRGPVDFMQFFIRNNLHDTYREVKKCLEIIITTPMITTDDKRCFHTVKNIRTFLQSTVSEDQLDALAMISIEHKLLNEIPNFNDQVIEEFAKHKDQRLQFIQEK